MADKNIDVMDFGLVCQDILSALDDEELAVTEVLYKHKANFAATTGNSQDRLAFITMSTVCAYVRAARAIQSGIDKLTGEQ